MAIDKKKKKPKPLLKQAQKPPVVTPFPSEYGLDFLKKLDRWLAKQEKIRRRERR